MTFLNDLPTVVVEAGDYVTRAGDRVTVHSVAPMGDPTTTAFRAKGTIWRMFRGKVRPRVYTIWHVSGRSLPLAEANTDIVGRWN